MTATETDTQTIQRQPESAAVAPQTGIVRPILKLGHPCLRRRADKVENIHDPKVQQLIDDLLATCAACDGVGLSAPQIGESVRVFVVASKPSQRYPHAPLVQPFAVINPGFEAQGEDDELGWEGCLSIPGLRAQVPRHNPIWATYQTRDGNETQNEMGDFIARVFQHEFDHLEGIFFFEQAAQSSYISEEEFQKLAADGKV